MHPETDNSQTSAAASSRVKTAPCAPLLLECGVKHYDWGQTGAEAFIPSLLSLAPGDSPWAELWAGAHPALPSKTQVEGRSVTLPELIEAAPEAMLGKESIARFGRELPYLFKILAASRPLSIQAHPDADSARAGFRREELSGLDRDDPRRNFRDPNPKPEIICAHTDFYALCGLRPIDEIRADLNAVPELAAPDTLDENARAFLYGRDSDPETFRAFFGQFMHMREEAAAKVLVPMLARLEEEEKNYRKSLAKRLNYHFGRLLECQALLQKQKDSQELIARRKRDERELRKLERESKTTRRYWILRANEGRMDNPDRGTLAMFFLNLVALEPGQSLFLAPGKPHSYLEGVGLELTGNSDNVLRAGLTSKQVNVDAFLNTVSFSFRHPTIYKTTDRDDSSHVYPIPFGGVELARIEIGRGKNHSRRTGHGPELLVCMQGKCEVKTKCGTLGLTKGGIAFVPAAAGGYKINADADGTQDTVLFRAGTRGRER